MNILKNSFFLKNKQATIIFYGSNGWIGGLFIDYIKQNHPDFNFKGKHAVILGAGGASRAICFALMKEKVKEITILNRSKNKGTVVQQASPTDELKKFKELLDMGAISQAEFDAKKKQLLGL